MATPIHAQNLIVNPSFEEYSVSCEDVFGQGRINDAFGWNEAHRQLFWSSDLISPCSWTSDYTPPITSRGYQQASFGTNYAFFATQIGWNSPSDIWIVNETLQPKILEKLIPETCYRATFDISLAEVADSTRTYGMDLYFSQDDFILTSHDRPSIVPQYSFFQLDTLSRTDWQKLSVDVQFSDTIQYLTLGWFSSPLSYSSYVNWGVGYFIDNVVLYPCNTPVYPADAGEDVTLCKGDSVELSTPYRNDEYMYWWVNSFGDTISTERTIKVDDSPSTYYLAQMDFKFDVTWDTVSVFNKSCLELDLPNVFTPNGDGENDVWVPLGKDIEQVDVQVFSRWGKLVYHYNGRFDDLIGWAGGDVPEGTYYVVAKGIGIDGKTIEEKGSITLLR